MIAAPALPVSVAALVMVGTVLGLTSMASGRLLPVPVALVALRVTVKLPLWFGVPTIWPELFTVRPPGRPAPE